MLTRRRFAQTACSMLALTALPGTAPWAAAGGHGRVPRSYKGVKLGVITYSLMGNPGPMPPGFPSPPADMLPPADRDPIDVIIERCIDVGAANIELLNVYGENPPPLVNGGRFGQVPDKSTPEYLESRERLRQWRLAQPLDRYHQVREKFQRAGLNLFSYVWTVADDDTPEEIDKGFQQLRALGVRIFCTNQTRYTMAPKIIPFAEKYHISPAWHPHDNTDDPREVATAQTLERLLDMSPEFRVNLDIGHFTAGNQDAVAFLEQHHARITHLHIKDRKRNHGPNVQLGTGETPITACLHLLRDRKWPIYALLEREYRGPGTAVEETRWQMQYMKRVLDT